RVSSRSNEVRSREENEDTKRRGASEGSVHERARASEARGNAISSCYMAVPAISDGHAAIDGIDIAGRERRFVGCEEHNHRGDLLRLGETPHRLPVDECLARLD